VRFLRTFAALLLAFGVLIIAQPAHAALSGPVNVTCEKDGIEGTYQIQWDNSNQFFEGQGDIAVLYCEGGYSPLGQGATYVSDDLADETLRYYNGIVPESQPVEPGPSPEPDPEVSEPVLEEEPTQSPSPEPTESPSPTENTGESDSPTAPEGAVSDGVSDESPQPSVPVDEPSVVPEPTPVPSPTPEVPAISEPVPQPSVEPVPQPTETEEPAPPEQAEPTPEPEPTLRPSEPPVIQPSPEPAPSPVVSPAPVEPDPKTEESLTPSPEPTPTQDPTAVPTTLQEVTLDTPIADIAAVLENVVPTSLTAEQVEVLVSIAMQTFETAERGSAEYGAALELLMIAAQADDIVLDENIAAIPLIGNVAGAAVELLNALSNVGADMSPQVREQSEKVIVAAVIVGQIAMTATAASAAARRP